MKIEGGCYCGAVRYRAEGDAVLKAQCFCRECQYISGGGPNLLIGVPEAGFAYTGAEPKAFRRSDLESPATREFCTECGTHLLSRAPGLPGVVMLKVGTLDDRAAFDGPQMSIFLCDKQDYHLVPENVPAFERMPG